MFRLRCVLLIVCLAVFGSAWSAKRISNKISELDFQDITVGDALRILSKQSDMNIISSKAAAEIQMTMYLRNIQPMAVLEAMAKTYNLWYEKDKKSGVIRVYTVKEFRLGNVDYRNERTEVFTFKHQRTSLDFGYMIQDLFGYGRVMLSQGADENEVINDLYERLERFDIIASNTYNQTDNSNSNGFGISSSGGGNNNSQNGNNNSNNNSRNGNNNNNSQNGNNNNRNGNYNNRNSNNRNGNGQNNGMFLGRNQAFDALEQLPKNETDAMLTGSHIGSTASMNELIEHVSPIYVTLIRRQNRVLVRTRDKDAMQEIQILFKKLNINMATLMLEVKVLELILNDGYESSFDFTINSGDFQVTKASSENFITAASNVSDLVRTGLGDPSMVAAVVSKNFKARLKLLEEEGRVTALATPMITTSNQEVSRIFIGEERPITTSLSVTCPAIATQSGVLGGGISQSVCIQAPDTEIRPIGKTLLLTPNISADGTVDIRLLVEDSRVCEGCGNIPNADGRGTLTNYKVDTVQAQTFSGDIVAENAQMIAVGGLINERSEDIEKKVPVLGDIPYLGFFFNDIQRVRRRTEMVILIRPYVMNNKEDDIDVNQAWLEANSIHPSADNLNHLDMYKNNQHLDKGYELQPDYKVYPLQDEFDSYHGKGAGAKVPKVAEPEQATFMQLTEYAARTVRLPDSKHEKVAGIQAVQVPGAYQLAEVFYDLRLTAAPVASWRKGGVYVTAVEVRNLSNETVTIDYQHLKGNWLASTIEEEKVAPRKDFGDMTYLYLLSSKPFEQALEY
ncbi:hypothetical protein AU255_04795 [Methyloprofundus sedimenti]|uniref:Type II/III secretion system secretin-like domain-containing protein n=1 Tax=Methyloprofundus sedimenti TaxID=1420851 RepID=A0A1V8M6L0_9GAMM|nr:DUF3438 family protein [Methyloprofundus sedimenti]OQK17214.1 hypothetical protein AU255_04795 [Methyloprofundus sedimenti]